MSNKVENKLEGRAKAQGIGNLMRPGVILSLVLISIFSLGALITLSGFAGDLRDTNNGQAHALSSSAIGYAGIVKLLREQDETVTLQRTEGVKTGNNDTLHIITFTQPYQMSALEDLDTTLPTLIVLPKWRVVKVPEKPSWVKRSNLFDSTLYKSTRLSTGLEDIVKFAAVSQQDEDDGTLTYDIDSQHRNLPVAKDVNIENLQYISGEGLIPLMTANTHTILAQISDTRLYILSDPDILNTAGISTKSRAQLAYGLITGLIQFENASEYDVIFDLHVHGFGRTQNLVKTLLTPPFLAATLCLLAAGALVAWQAFSRYGDPARTERDYALGKYTLADNGARFIRIAQKETSMGTGYLALIKRLIAKDFYLEKHSASQIDEFLEAREDNLNMKIGLGELSPKLEHAENTQDYLEAAQALYDWRQEITHDR